MKKLILSGMLCSALLAPVSAQRFFTRDARVQFNSDAPMEKIEALNKSGTAVVDSKTGKMEWKVLIKNFIFEKALMQEHFNENYMESGKYPNAIYKGEITNLSAVHFDQDGTYKVQTRGIIEIHGVKKEIEVPGTIVVSKGAVKINATFLLACADFNIQIPGVVRDKIAKEVAVKIDASLNPMH